MPRRDEGGKVTETATAPLSKLERAELESLRRERMSPDACAAALIQQLTKLGNESISGRVVHAWRVRGDVYWIGEDIDAIYYIARGGGVGVGASNFGSAAAAEILRLVVREEESDQERPPRTLCLQCGPDVPIDEDGCCSMCGGQAMGPWLGRIRLLDQPAPEGEKA